MTYEDWIEKYGGEGFPLARFRPRAAFTTDFGLDNTFGTLRLHNGIDRGRGANGEYTIFSPFDFASSEWLSDYPSYGSMLRLFCEEAGFEMRIAHIEVLPADFKRQLTQKEPVDMGQYMCEAGNKGVGTGRHTHTEIVSDDEVCGYLERLLKRKYGPGYDHEYTTEKIEAYGSAKGINDPMKEFAREKERRNIRMINGLLCRRVDYHTGELKTFYSSRALFGL